MNNTFKGTPGPWEAHYDDNGFFYIIADDMPRPYVMATGGEGDIDKTNSQLAACAPDLLEALQELMRFESELRLVMGEKLQYPDNFLKALDAARAAIAKALNQHQNG